MDLDLEKKRLLERDAEWAAVAADGRDIERVLSFWTDDAIVFSPGRPAVAGKAALRRMVEDSWAIPGFRITWTPTDCAFSPDGNLAYTLAKTYITMNGPDGTPTTTNGRGVAIWRREPDGDLRCVVDISNAEPAV